MFDPVLGRVGQALCFIQYSAVGQALCLIQYSAVGQALCWGVSCIRFGSATPKC